MYYFNHNFKFMVPIIIAVIVALGGVSFAAQNALPGDTLYPVKVDVNEKVQVALAFSDQAKAQVEVQQAAERLKEAEELAVKTDVSDETQLDLETNFTDFANRVEERIASLDTNGNATAALDATSNFEAALQAHQKVLARLALQDKTTKSEVDDLQKDVNDEVNTTDDNRVKLEGEVRAEGNGPDVQTAAQGKITAATNVIAEVTSFIDSKKDMLGVSATAQAQAQLSIAKDQLAQAQAKFDAKAYADAFNLANTALRTAQRAKMLIEVQGDIDVDLHLGGRPTATPSSGNGVSPSPRPSHSPEPEVSVKVEGGLDFGF